MTKLLFRDPFLKIEDTTIPLLKNTLPISTDKHDAVFIVVPDYYFKNPLANQRKGRVNKAKYCPVLPNIGRKDTPEEPKFSCPTCGRGFQSAYKYSLHLHNHDTSKDYTCPNCSFTTPRLKSISAHIQSHFKRYERTCKHCGKGFNNSVNLMEHEEIHLGDSGEFVCVVCHKAFSEHDRLTMHQLRYHRVPVELKRTKECDICGKIYTRAPNLERHMKNVHGQGIARKKIERETFCSICGKHFNYLKGHLKIHENYRPYKCAFCEKSFSRRGRVARHERSHTGEKPYACEICGKNLSDKGTLDRHMRVHAKRPCKCRVCDRTFKTKKSYNTHLKSCPR